MPDRVRVVAAAQRLPRDADLDVSSHRWALMLTDAQYVSAHRDDVAAFIDTQPWMLVAILHWPRETLITAGSMSLAVYLPGDVDGWLALLHTLLDLASKPRTTWPHTATEDEGI